MNYERLMNIDAQRARRYRLVAYVGFFLCMAALLLGVVPGLYFGNGWWVLGSLLAAGAFFFLAFFAGGIGWSRFDTPTKTRSAISNHTRHEPPVAPLNTPEELARPYAPPGPTDQTRPPFE